MSPEPIRPFRAAAAEEEAADTAAEAAVADTTEAVDTTDFNDQGLVICIGCFCIQTKGF